MKITRLIKKYKLPITITSIIIILLIGVGIGLYFLLLKKEPNKKELISNNHALQFNNVSKKNIWIIFSMNDDNINEINNNWLFYNNNELVTGTYIANNSMLYFGPIQPFKKFSAKYKLDGVPKWTSGKCSILPISPPKDISVGGLTALEWTFNDSGTLNPDISALDGINIKVDMELIGNETCKNADGNGKYYRKCMLENIYDSKYNKFKKTKVPHIQIPSIMRIEYDEKTKHYRGTDGIDGPLSKCGINDNCVECPTGHDPCACPTGPPCIKDPEYAVKGLRAECYYTTNHDKWGCYKWWSDPNNELAQEWLELFKEGSGCSNTYRWVYDETKLQNYDPKKHKDKILWDKKNEPDIWDESIAFKCSQGILPVSECDGYIVKNESEVNINCDKTTPTTKLIFNIYDILI